MLHIVRSLTRRSSTRQNHRSLIAILICFITPVFATDDDVRILTYNLKNYTTEVRSTRSGLPATSQKPEQEIDALVAVIASTRPHILGICEIGNEHALIDLQQRLKAADIDLPHRSIQQGIDPDRKLAVLSSFPVRPNHVPRYDYPIENTRLPISRAILDVTVTVSQHYNLRMVGVHLKSKREVPNFDQSEMRRNEAFLVRKHVTAILADSPDTNLMIYGDFNDTKQSSTFDMVRGAGPIPHMVSDLRLKDSRGEVWTHFWGQEDVYSRIDYVLVSRGMRGETIHSKSRVIDHPQTAIASDHRPLLVTVTPRD